MGRRPARKHGVLARPKHGPTRNALCPCMGRHPSTLGGPARHGGNSTSPLRPATPTPPAGQHHSPDQHQQSTADPASICIPGVGAPPPHAQTLIHFPRRPQRLAASSDLESADPLLSSSPPLLRLSPQIRRQHADPRLPFPSPVSRRCPRSAPRRRDS
jgi:hypothetical protein